MKLLDRNDYWFGTMDSGRKYKNKKKIGKKMPKKKIETKKYYFVRNYN